MKYIKPYRRIIEDFNVQMSQSERNTFLSDWGVTSIVVRGPYSEAINIVIEEIPLDELRENKFKSLL